MTALALASLLLAGGPRAAPLSVQTWSLEAPPEAPQPAESALAIGGWEVQTTPAGEGPCAPPWHVFRDPTGGALIDGRGVGYVAAPPAAEPLGLEGVAQLNTVACTCCCAAPNAERLALPRPGGVDVVQVPLSYSDARCAWSLGLGSPERVTDREEARLDRAARTLYFYSARPVCAFEPDPDTPEHAHDTWMRPVEATPSSFEGELFSIIRFTPGGIVTQDHRDEGIPAAHRAAWEAAERADPRRASAPLPACPLVRYAPAAEGLGQALVGRVADIVSSSPLLPSADPCLDYDAPNLVDGRLDTSWQEAGPGGGEGEWLAFQFDAPVDLVAVEIANGFQSTHKTYGDLYPLNGRVAKLSVAVNGEPAGALALEDVREMQRLRLAHWGVTEVRLTIAETLPGTKWADTALSEVRFIAAE